MPNRSPNPDFVFNTRNLSKHSGAISVVEREVPAPEGLTSGVIGVPTDSTIYLDLRLESVIEGVLVSGVADVTLTGECARCLAPVEMDEQIDIQELFLYPGKEDDDEDAYRIEDDELNLEPVLRDAVVLALPYSPLCADDCAGLCLDCGVSLNDDPNHSHGDKIDPRWAELAAWRDSAPSQEQEKE